jgi:hypothetical protein
MNKYLISTQVESQLPDFVRGDFPTFVKFLEKYYEWTEQNNNITKASEDLYNAIDVDLASDYYVELIKKEFLPYFPEILDINKRLFVKNIYAFYKAKGTPNSIKFLFRALYNEEIEIYFPKDDILKASDGKWVLPLALRVETADTNIFNISNSLLVGQTSKATAIVERVIRSVDRLLGVNYTEIYISNVSKTFQNGETVTATYFNGTTNVTVSGIIVGSLSDIRIDTNNRGSFYVPFNTNTGYPGDPVTIVGGLNPTSNIAQRAVAYVAETSSGGIPDIFISNGGFGFRNPSTNANTSIIDFTNGFDDGSFGAETRAQITLLDESVSRRINVSNSMISTINSTVISSIENTAISSISTYQTFNVFPIASVTVLAEGFGYRVRPDVDIYSFYMEQNTDTFVPAVVTVTRNQNFISNNSVNFTTFFEPGNYARLFVSGTYEEVLRVTDVTSNTVTFSTNFQSDLSGVSVFKLNRSELRNIGSLGRVEIINGGTGYANNNTLTFTGGSGYGANGFVTVNSTGTIIGVTINAHSSNAFAVGGEGYTVGNLPDTTINTVGGANAVLRVNEILGDGEQLDFSTAEVGRIEKLRVTSFGYDYVSSPTISLRNADLVLNDVTPGQLFDANTGVYQGTSNANTTFFATVDSYNPSTGQLRIFDYRGTLNTSAQIISVDNSVLANISSFVFYGDGRAQATSNFENGLIRLPGLYLNTDGQLSADKKLQDGDRYHNFSYVINTKESYDSFRNSLNSIGHPIGTKVFVNRIDDNQEIANSSIGDQSIIQITSPITFNIANGNNSMLSTNVSANAAATINVGDIVILNNVSKTISGNASVNLSSNVVTGNGTNFINDLMEGDSITIYTSNSSFNTTVSNVVSSNVIVVQDNVLINTYSINTAAVILDILAAAVSNEPANTLFKTAQVGGRSLGDINDDGIISSADALEYNKWTVGLANTSSNTWIENTLHPYMLGNVSTYSNYLLINNTNSVNINLVFNDTKTVTFSNANTVLVSTNFTTNSNFVTTSVQKLR